MRGLGYYVLDDDGAPRPVENVLEWGKWFAENGERRVLLQTHLRAQGGDMAVSSVFLGIDHGFTEGEPVLWETMVFDSPDGNRYQRRFTDPKACLAYHALLLADFRLRFDATLIIEVQP